MSKGWHIVEGDGVLTLCRQMPPRFDFAVRAMLPAGDARRLAHQIRQDVWRACKRLRGFSPVVELRRTAAGYDLRVGGRVAGRVPKNILERIEIILSDSEHRLRWVRHARKGS